MISFRLAVGDQSRRYFKVKRDNTAVYVSDVAVKLRAPSGAVKTGVGVIEEPELGQFYIAFGQASLTLTEPGEWDLELVVNGEHIEEPYQFWVRPEYVEGPR